MIIDFSLSNIYSIKDEVTFSFLSDKKRIDDDLKYISIENGLYNLYSFSAIYGPNASGKTNVIKALSSLIGFILFSHRLDFDQKIPVYEPFRLDEAYKSKESKFQIEFCIENVRYNYSFVFNEKNILFEELFFYPNGKRATLFIREEGKPVKYGSYFTGEKKILETLLLSNKLFLSIAANSNNTSLQKIFLFFKNHITMHVRMDSSNILYHFTTRELKKNENIYKSMLIEILKAADLSVNDIKVIEEKNTENQLTLPKNMPDEIKKRFIEDFQTKVYFGHNIYKDGEKTDKVEYFNLEEDESTGTIKMYDLAGEIVNSLKNGTVLIIDEFNSVLHPLLNQFIIELFINPKINKQNAQLLISTHDTCILDTNRLRREQIWFTDKKPDGSTELYSLNEFDKNLIRNNDKYGKFYLDGRFGAVPAIDSSKIAELFDA